jgi:GTPase
MEPESIDEKDQLRIGVLGNVDSGKTTLISVIANNILDNGRGLARKRVLKHNHEQESGRTSSITHTYFKTDNNRVISFIDLAGHEKYYKTTIFGANSCSLDYIMILVGANMGVSLMTREHLLLTFILKIPFIVVITKTDLAPENVLENTLNDITKVIKKYKPEHSLSYVESPDDYNIYYRAHLNKAKKIPYFMISNTTGENIPLITNYLKSLEIYHDWDCLKENETMFIVEDIYSVNGVGLVTSGTLNSGVIKKGEKFMIGPIDGTFHEVIVKSIHDNYKTLIDNLSAGCSGCICIKSTEKRLNLKKSLIRRGMLVISKNHNKFTTDKFQAKVKILHHPTTIKKNYESIIHCGSIRQTAKIIEIDKDLLRTGDQSIVTFQFKSRPEFVQLNKQIMFREGKTKGIGVVTQIL